MIFFFINVLCLTQVCAHCQWGGCVWEKCEPTNRFVDVDELCECDIVYNDYCSGHQDDCGCRIRMDTCAASGTETQIQKCVGVGIRGITGSECHTVTRRRCSCAGQVDVNCEPLVSPSPTPSKTPSPTPSSSPTPTPSLSPSPTPSRVPTPSASQSPDFVRTLADPFQSDNVDEEAPEKNPRLDAPNKKEASHTTQSSVRNRIAVALLRAKYRRGKLCRGKVDETGLMIISCVNM